MQRLLGEEKRHFLGMFGTPNRDGLRQKVAQYLGICARRLRVWQNVDAGAAHSANWNPAALRKA